MQGKPETTSALHASQDLYKNMQLRQPTFPIMQLLARFGIKNAAGLAAFLESPAGKKERNNIIRDMLALDALLQQRLIDNYLYEVLLHRIAINIAMQHDLDKEARFHNTITTAAIQTELDKLHQKNATKDTIETPKLRPEVKELMAAYTLLEKNVNVALDAKLQEASELLAELALVKEEQTVMETHYDQLSDMITPDILTTATPENIDDILAQIKTRHAAVFQAKSVPTPREEQPMRLSGEDVLEKFRAIVQLSRSQDIYWLDNQGNRTQSLHQAAYLVPRQYQLVLHEGLPHLFGIGQQAFIFDTISDIEREAARKSYEAQRLSMMNLPEFIQHHHQAERSFYSQLTNYLQTRQVQVQSDVSMLTETLTQIKQTKESLYHLPVSKPTHDSTKTILYHVANTFSPQNKPTLSKKQPLTTQELVDALKAEKATRQPAMSPSLTPLNSKPAPSKRKSDEEEQEELLKRQKPRGNKG